MSRLTAIRRALLGAVAPAVGAAWPGAKAEVITGPAEGPAAFQGGRQKTRMVIRVYVGPVDDKLAQAALDVLLDPDEDGSIRAALAADGPHDELIKSFQILSTSGWRTWRLSNDSPPLLGAEFQVEVVT